MDCERCGKDVDTHPTVDVSNTDRLALCQDRHPKWQRVEAGTVIPAGQPYRTEWSDPSGDSANERVSPFQQTVPPSPDWFIDSSWKPPLVLPTTPTWGIVLSKTADRKDGHTFDLGRWAVYGDEEWSPLERTHRSKFDTPCDVLSRDSIADFIELTPEQVARLEQNR